MTALIFDWDLKDSEQSDYPDLEKDWTSASWKALDRIETVLDVITQFTTDLSPELYRDKNAEIYESIFSERFPRRDQYVLSIYQGIKAILQGKITLQLSDQYAGSDGKVRKNALATFIDHDGDSAVVQIWKPGLKMPNDGDESKALILIHELAHAASYVTHPGFGGEKLVGVTDVPDRIPKSDSENYNPNKSQAPVARAKPTYRIDEVKALAKKGSNYTYRLADAYRVYAILGHRADIMPIVPVDPRFCTGAIKTSEGVWTVAGDGETVNPYKSYEYYPGVEPKNWGARGNPQFPTVAKRDPHWVAENRISKWLNVPSGYAGFGIELPISTTVDVNSVFILVCWSCDNNGHVYLTPGHSNEGFPTHPVHSVNGNFGDMHGFYISGKNGLVNGPNTLWFNVNNTGGPGGLRVEVARHPALL